MRWGSASVKITDFKNGQERKINGNGDWRNEMLNGEARIIDREVVASG